MVSAGPRAAAPGPPGASPRARACAAGRNDPGFPARLPLAGPGPSPNPEEWRPTMLECEVTLAFACCICEHSVSVRVHCSGKGLAAGPRTVAAVNVPCPHCGLVNQLSFEPNGTVRSVAPYTSPRPLPEPSVN